jgi:hypothetical protein
MTEPDTAQIETQISYSELPEEFKEIVDGYTMTLGVDINGVDTQFRETVLNEITSNFFSHLAERFDFIASEQARKEYRMLVKSGWNTKLFENNKDLKFYLDLALNYVIRDQTSKINENK